MWIAGYKKRGPVAPSKIRKIGRVFEKYLCFKLVGFPQSTAKCNFMHLVIAKIDAPITKYFLSVHHNLLLSIAININIIALVNGVLN